ncbi:MAG: murein biosynthesis integral membrane protein MurJ, partial [Synergistetes bacterium]|nr:murein biosynthesis integral membrane protein MurJ [Synergistota bacterium]
MFFKIIKKFSITRLLELDSLKEAIRSLRKWDLEREEKVLEAVIRSSFLNLLARGIGYLKNVAIAVLLGFSAKTDGYFMALSLLGIFIIFSDVFESIGVPNLVKARQENMGEFKRLSGFLFAFALTLAILSSVFAFLLMPLILKIPFGFKEEALNYLKVSYLLLLPYLFFSFIFQHFGAVLRSLRRFTAYFVAEFIISLSSFLMILFGLLAFRDYWVLPLSLVLSQLIGTLFITFKGREFFHLRFYKDEKVKTILKCFFQLSILYGVFHLYIMVDRAFASILPEKSVSALSYGLVILTGLK